MVLYHASRTVMLANIIIHRLTQNSNEQATLLVSSNENIEGCVTKLFPNYMNLKAEGIFDNIFTCNTYSGFCNKEKPPQIIEKAIVHEYDSVLESNNINLANISKIYNITDWDCEFGIYLSIKKTHYYLLELIPDQFAFAKTVYKTISHTNYAQVVQKHLALCGANDYCTPIVHPNSAKSIALLAHKETLFFDSKYALHEISSATGGSILIAYGFEWVRPTEPKTAIVYMQSSHLLKVNLQNNKALASVYPVHHESLYPHCLALAMDYFIDDDCAIYLKPHPSSFLTDESILKNYSSSIKSVGILPVDFFKFAPEMLAYKFDYMLAFGSTANSMLVQNYQQGTVLTQDYWSTFHLYHRIYTCLFATENCLSQDVNIFCHGVEAGQVNLLCGRVFHHPKSCKYLNNLANIPIGCALLVECCDSELMQKGLLNAPENAVIFFLNFQKQYAFLEIDDHSFLENILPITIRKIDLKPQSPLYMHSETIYVFCKNKKILRQINCLNLEKSLTLTGIKLETKQLSQEQIELGRLEARVEFTEKMIKKLLNIQKD